MTSSALQIGFVPIARSTFDTVLAAEVTAGARALLMQAGLALCGPAEAVSTPEEAQAAAEALAHDPLDLLVIFQSTFADSTMALALAQRLDVPLLLWAVPEARTGGRLNLNSLCGINLAGHALTRAGQRYEYVYAPANDPAAINKIMPLAQAGYVYRLLRQARVGRLGENPAGFDSCLFDGTALQARFGLEVVQVDLPGFFDRVRATDGPQVEAAATQVRERVAGLDALDQTALRGTLQTYVTLHQMAAEENLHGLAVRCWPEFFTDLGCAACGAVSLLNDELTPGCCEADVNGTITQLVLQWLSGGPAMSLDLVSFELDQDAAVLWHCGQAPLAMADPAFQPRGTVHSNRKLPLLMEFPLKPGRVTLARLSEAGGAYRLVIGGGEMLPAPPSFSGTSGVVRFDRPAGDVLDTLLHEGLEHHIALTYGDHLAALQALARLYDLPVLHL